MKHSDAAAGMLVVTPIGRVGRITRIEKHQRPLLDRVRRHRLSPRRRRARPAPIARGNTARAARGGRRSMSLYVGDVRDGLRQFAAEGIRAQTCVTSPPYWGLRDYGTAQWEGGDNYCDHLQPTGQRQDTGRRRVDGFNRPVRKELAAKPYVGVCPCGARRVDQQLGLEPTIAEYVANMVEVFRLVRDVLADDGTLWLNLGDSYAAGGRGGGGSYMLERKDAVWSGRSEANGWRAPSDGLKQKDLCGIPWRVAFALQADGWYLRSDIIWAKPNPMPESVTDRPTKAHEYLFLLTKSERYYYDAAAIAEPTNGRELFGNSRRLLCDDRNDCERRDMRENWSRNRRTVWTIATEAYPDAHFATFPTALVEPCIAAGSRVGDTVLDPFMGSGTVAQVAQQLGREWIGCELNPDYAEMVRERTRQNAMVLTA